MAEIVNDYFIYTASFGSIAASASADVALKIQADSSFVVLKMMYFAAIATATQTDSTRVIPILTLQVTDSGSGRNIFNEAVPLAAVAGTGQLPYLLPEPKLFKPNSILNVNLANLTSDIYTNVQVLFAGKKVFQLGSQ